MISKLKKRDPYVGEFRALVREMLARGLATPANVDKRARDYVRECGCSIVVLDRLDGRGGVSMIAVAPSLRLFPTKKRRTS